MTAGESGGKRGSKPGAAGARKTGRRPARRPENRAFLLVRAVAGRRQEHGRWIRRISSGSAWKWICDPPAPPRSAGLPPAPPLPAGYRFVPWNEALLDVHARTKFRSFRDEIDAAVFPCLGDLDGCRRLMREIRNKSGVSSGRHLADRLGQRPGRPRLVRHDPEASLMAMASARFKISGSSPAIAAAASAHASSSSRWRASASTRLLRGSLEVTADTRGPCGSISGSASAG